MAVNYKSLAKTGLYSKKKIADAKVKVDKAMAGKSSGGSSGGAKPLVASYDTISPQARANVDAQVSRVQGTRITPTQKNMAISSAIGSTNFGLGTPKSVGSGYGGGSGGSWGETPKLELSVLPGNKPGPMMTYSGQMPGAQMGGSAGTNAQMTAQQAEQERKTRWTETASQIAAGFTPVGAVGTGARIGVGAARTASKTATWTSLLTKARSMGDDAFNAVRNLFKRGGDDSLKAADDLLKRTQRVEPPTLAPPRPTAMSNLGNVIKTGAKWGTAAAMVGAAGSGAVSVVRNALPASGTTPAGSAGSTPSGLGPTGSPEGAPQESAQRTTSTSSLAPTSFGTALSYDSSSFASGITGGSSGIAGGAGGTGAGSTGAYALRGESLTEQQAAAQARALELQRQQSSTAGIAPSPVGDTVDLAGLQQLRDQAKNLLDQYGTEATTMPEFKAAVQGMIASGIQNLRALQPTPPEPVEETPEETAAYANLAPQEAFSVRQYMDDMRRSLGMPALETQKADLNRQMTAVNQAYQAVIDQIKENPNLPKGLAARRLTEQFEDQKFALSTIMSELDIIQDQIDSGNEQLSNARADLGLQLQFNENMQKQEDKQYERNMDKFGIMVESRAIGGMSETEMRQWSAVTGISLGAIRKLRDNALDSENEREVSFERDANDNLLMVTYDKKNPLDKTVERIGSVKSPSGGTSGGGAGGFSDLDLLANTVLGTGSVAKQERDFATYEALKAQDPKKAEEWLYGKVATGLGAGQKNDFRVFGSVVDGADSALARIQQFASANPGVYASIYNKAAPYLTASRDQNYVKLMQEVTSIGNEYRNAIFGASLTGNEQTEGLKVVIGTNDDLPTIITKLQGLSELSQRIRQRIILDAAGQINQSLTDGGPGSISSQQQDQEYSMDDEEFNSVTGTQDSGGFTRYISNLWDALRGN